MRQLKPADLASSITRERIAIYDVASTLLSCADQGLYVRCLDIIGSFNETFFVMARRRAHEVYRMIARVRRLSRQELAARTGGAFAWLHVIQRDVRNGYASRWNSDYHIYDYDECMPWCVVEFREPMSTINMECGER